jgi:type IV pilus assembly protein PilV
MGAGQSGSMLLEALIAILIFSLGILTVIGIQATSIRLAADAQLRSKAALLADWLVGEMWASGGKIGDMATKFASPGGSEYAKWLNCHVTPNDTCSIDGFTPDIRSGLPGVVAGGDTEPSVTIVTGGVIGGEARNVQVTITLFWRTPSMDADETPHQHIVISHISRNP